MIQQVNYEAVSEAQRFLYNNMKSKLTIQGECNKGGLAVATNQGVTLRSHRRSEGGIDVASRQARDRQVQYLNAQQAKLESEVEREFLSGSDASCSSRQELTDASDLAPVEIGTPGSSLTDIDSILMLVSISGSANLQHRIRQLCRECFCAAT
jgi:hypothetical protein